MNRRRALIGLGILATGGALYYWERSGGTDNTLSPPEAHALALSGDILLIDIRRPDEWERTGSGEGAIRLDLRRKDFTDQLLTLASGNKNAKIALICAAGVRSRRLSRRLISAGFTRIIDIPEGMTGSSAGPGWIARELPLVRG